MKTPKTRVLIHLHANGAREKDKASRTGVFQRAIANMKTLAEGGKLAPRQ